MNFRLIGINGRFVHASLGLMYVRQQLLRHVPGCCCTLLERTINDPYYDLLVEAAAEGVDVLFLSAYVWNAHVVERLLQDLSRLKPDVPVVVGGPQAKHLFTLQEIFPSVTVVSGEVEGLADVFYQDVMDGRLGPFYQSEPAQHFSMPFIDEDQATHFSLRYIYYEGSRGCPFRCSYCLSSREAGVRQRAVDRVVSELDWLFAKEPKSIRFVDRTFNLDPDRTLAIWRHILEQTKGKRKTTFHFEMAPDRFSKEMFACLQDTPPGVFEFELGIQSTNKTVLKAIDRVIDLPRSLANIRKLSTLATVHLHVDLILGLPFENEESFLDSFRDIFFLGTHYIQMGLLKVLPDTPLANQADEWGMVRASRPPYEILETKWLEHGQLAHLYRFGKCVEQFHNNRWFLSVWRYLRQNKIDPVPLFQCLTHMKNEKGSAGLGQETLSTMLWQALIPVIGQDLCHELLVHDWLATGHQFLPKHLAKKETSLSCIKRDMGRQLPQTMDRVYDFRSRDEFLKTTIFYPFSRRAAFFLGGPDEKCIFAFTSARKKDLFTLQKVHVIEPSCLKSR